MLDSRLISYLPQPLYGEEEEMFTQSNSEEWQGLQLQEKPNRVLTAKCRFILHEICATRANTIGVFQIYRSDRRKMMIVKDRWVQLFLQVGCTYFRFV
jgi:hypothetical protein